MSPPQYDPAAHGVEMSRAEFADLMHSELARYGRGALGGDELLLRPRVALLFCITVREKYRWSDLPDDVILWNALTHHPS
jgi:hypothetical protein